jgi:hypothetical protein
MVNILKRFIFLTLQFFIFILWKFNLNFIISFILGTIVIFHNKSEITKNIQKTTILALQRNIFNDDIKALKEYPSKYKFLKFPVLLRALMCDEAYGIWPKELMKQTYFYTKKDKYSTFYNKLSYIFIKTLNFVESILQINIKVILTANIDYFQDYHWIKAIHKKNGKFIVLDKESILFRPDSENRLVSWYKKHKFVYEGDAVFFYNELAMNVYINSGAVKPIQSFVTGSPRVDRLTSLSTEINNCNGNYILLTSFMEPAYGAVKLWNEIINIIYKNNFFRDRTIVKCRDFKEVKIIRKFFPDLKAVSGSIENYFKKNPTIFIGFNSTSCLDALIVGIPVLIPCWGEAKNVCSLLGEHTKDIHLIANNQKSFVKILEKYLSNSCKTKNDWNNIKLNKILEKHYSFIDGKNCYRFFSYLDKILM